MNIELIEIYVFLYLLVAIMIFYIGYWLGGRNMEKRARKDARAILHNEFENWQSEPPVQYDEYAGELKNYFDKARSCSGYPEYPETIHPPIEDIL